MMDNEAQYEQILERRVQDDYTIMKEAEKHFRQAVANYNASKKYQLAHYREKERRLKGMNVNGIYTAQKDNGTRDTFS